MNSTTPLKGNGMRLGMCCTSCAILACHESWQSMQRRCRGSGQYGAQFSTAFCTRGVLLLLGFMLLPGLKPGQACDLAACLSRASHSLTISTMNSTTNPKATWAAPEVTSRVGYSHECDRFSLGALLYKCEYGVLLFDGIAADGMYVTTGKNRSFLSLEAVLAHGRGASVAHGRGVSVLRSQCACPSITPLGKHQSSTNRKQVLTATPFCFCSPMTSQVQ
jgi:hypothetical protein